MKQANGRRIFPELCSIFLVFVAITAVASVSTVETASPQPEIHSVLNGALIEETIITTLTFNASDLSQMGF